MRFPPKYFSLFSPSDDGSILYSNLRVDLAIASPSISKMWKPPFLLSISFVFRTVWGASWIVPGAVWYDTAGQKIDAHGGGVVRRGSTWYWVGYSASDSEWFVFKTGEEGVSARKVKEERAKN